jgi:uncharacterized protein
MLPLIAERRPEIAALCRRFGVRRLSVFGSAARGEDFDPQRSDVDFVVAFERADASLGEFLAFRDALAAAVHRPVDLVVEGSVRNPFARFKKAFPPCALGSLDSSTGSERPDESLPTPRPAGYAFGQPALMHDAPQRTVGALTQTHSDLRRP